jgi:hypothetical protein
MVTKPRKTFTTKVRATVNLFDGPANDFKLFKVRFGILTDADAMRQLATQRLAQLRRSGKLAKSN